MTFESICDNYTRNRYVGTAIANYRLSREDAEDVVQELFIRFALKFDQVAPDGRKKCLERAFTNACISKIRSNRRAMMNRPACDLIFDDGTTPLDFVPCVRSEKEADSIEVELSARAVLSNLPEKARPVFMDRMTGDRLSYESRRFWHRNKDLFANAYGRVSA